MAPRCIGCEGAEQGGSPWVTRTAWRLLAVGLGPGPDRAQPTRPMAQAFLIPGAKLMADGCEPPGSLQIPAQFLALPSLNPYYYYFKLSFLSVES